MIKDFRFQDGNSSILNQGGKTNILSYVSCFYLKCFVKIKKKPFLRECLLTLWQLQMDQLKHKLMQKLQNITHLDNVTICCKAQSFFIKQLMSCQLCALWIFLNFLPHSWQVCYQLFSFMLLTGFMLLFLEFIFVTWNIRKKLIF